MKVEDREPVTGGGNQQLVLKDERQRNRNWQIRVNKRGAVTTADAILATLMDLRDELGSIWGMLDHLLDFHRSQAAKSVSKKPRRRRRRSR